MLFAIHLCFFTSSADLHLAPCCFMNPLFTQLGAKILL